MKLLIASDIHGSAFYCRKLFEAAEKENPEKIILLGDLLYHGPRNDLPEEYAPKETAKILNAFSSRIISVRGNCEAEVDQMMLSFPVLSDSAVLFADGHTFLCVHGHHLADAPDSYAGIDVLLTGHTHVPLNENRGSYLHLNPGSVSIPKENTPHGYILYEDGVFTWKTLDGETFDTAKL